MILHGITVGFAKLIGGCAVRRSAGVPDLEYTLFHYVLSASGEWEWNICGGMTGCVASGATPDCMNIGFGHSHAQLVGRLTGVCLLLLLLR
jgi:hypothetical protein